MCENEKEAIEIVNELINYIVDYNSCYAIIEEIQNGIQNHPKTLKRANTFFGMAQHCAFNNILQIQHRLFNENDAMSVNNVLNAIKKNMNTYSIADATKSKITDQSKKYKHKYKALGLSINKLNTLRNKHLAHFDNTYFLNLEELYDKYGLTNHQIKELMKYADEVCSFLYLTLTNSEYMTTPLFTDDIQKIYSIVDHYYSIPINIRMRYRKAKD